MSKAKRLTRGSGVGIFLGVGAALVLVLSLLQWQSGLFFAVLAVTLLVAGSPLIFASLLVRRSLRPAPGPRRRLNWKPALLDRLAGYEAPRVEKWLDRVET